MPKLLRTLRLDLSDTFVFERPAEPGLWAVPGSFLFWDADLETMAPKTRAAFRSGFLDVRSLGFSTLVEVAEIGEADLRELTEILARHLLERFGAPSLEAAQEAARDEVAFAASLCFDSATACAARTSRRCSRMLRIAASKSKTGVRPGIRGCSGRSVRSGSCAAAISGRVASGF